ncbi:DUF2147 domain-containing protein [Flavihumibacter rivuli]|uniref:DUF2147 domain-containing protein n=1 Tax=Flavihumibacter rivuli TaxID=2838156 RepID=UPI001BDEBF00|nr:DUF2147 domain-containing protein [Flavihumibacter rivuli]ULQ57220.1 DUF2147 domain-containing protein [Flavihumibacter rivuli]
MYRKLPYYSLIGLIILVATSAFTLLKSTNNSPDAIVGIWKTESGKGHVQIYKQGEKYFGKIVWLKEPNDEQGKPKLDSKNENTKLRTRPILGIVNLRDFRFAKPGLWEDGRIYNPEDGEDYKCKITLKDPNKIEVRGFIGISLIGKTQVWTREK